MALDPETLSALTASVRRFVETRLIPSETEVAETDRVPDAIVDEMRAMGLFGFAIPEAYGGLGLDMAEEVALVLELARAAPVFRSVVGTNNGIGSQGLLIAGSEAQKRRYLPRLASGELIGAFALTEPEAGSDAAAVATRARRDGDEYVLNGTKRFITNATVAGLFTVFARTDGESRGAGGISAFLVERDAPGLTVGRPYRKMGQQGAQVADVRLEDCRVPADALMGREGEGFKTAMRTLDRARIHMAAVCVAIAERLIGEALAYAARRRQFGRPIAEFQLIQAMLADSRAEAFAGRSMVEETARRRDAGADVTVEASACKLFCSEMVGRVADRAVQIHGGAGYVSDHAVERLYRDVRLFRIYEGTSQIQQLIIARAMLREHESG